MDCPNCEKIMRDKSYWYYGMADWDMDYPATLHEEYYCKCCRIKYVNGEWFIPDEIGRATYKQIKCANFICRELGISFEPVVKTKTWEFINTYLDAAKQNSKQRRDANFKNWCEDNLDWLPEYF